MKRLYEILIPTTLNDGQPANTGEWRQIVREITGGLTMLQPVHGEWVAPTGEVFIEQMIPVRLMATAEQIEHIADLSASFFQQLAMMFYAVSDAVTVKSYAA